MIASAPSASGCRVETFFRELRDRFDRACHTLPVHADGFTLAGGAVSLTFAGAAARDSVLPALAHLPRASATGALRVSVFDTASSGVAPPPPPWASDAHVTRGEVVGLRGSHVQLAFEPGSSVLSLYDSRRGEALVWMEDAARSPAWERAAPLRTVLHWWCANRGLQLVHGAAIGRGEHGLLLTGRGGSGKSTSALAALAAGLHYLGDDYVVCDLDGPGARVHSLYNSAKLDAAGLRLLPRLAAVVDLPAAAGEDKSVLFTARSFADRLRASLPLRAIVVPTLAPGPAGPQRIGGAQAFLALAPTTLFQLPGAGRESTALLRDLVTRLPCYRLHLAADAAAVVEGLCAVMDAAG